MLCTDSSDALYGFFRCSVRILQMLCTGPTDALHRYLNKMNYLYCFIFKIHYEKKENIGEHLLNEQRKYFNELEDYLESDERISVRNEIYIKRLYRLYGDYLLKRGLRENDDLIELVPRHTEDQTLKRFVEVALEMYEVLLDFEYGTHKRTHRHKMSKQWAAFFMKHFVCHNYSRVSLRRYFWQFTDENESENDPKKSEIEQHS